MLFTKNKFKSLDNLKKHKKCAEILRKFYKDLSEEKNILHYYEMISWMGLELKKLNNRKEIANRYHYHLKKSNFNLKEHNFLPNITTKDLFLEKKEFLQNAIFLDNLRSAFNVGNIIRTTEALRIGSIHCSKNTPSIDSEKVIKTSMGTSTHVKIYSNSDIETLPKPIIVLETAENGINIFDFIFPKNFTLVLGNEEYGVSDEILKKADFALRIPLYGRKNSINVSAAYAICAAEIAKQNFFYD